jgi:hypothetical protein
MRINTDTDEICNFLAGKGAVTEDIVSPAMPTLPVSSWACGTCCSAYVLGKHKAELSRTGG